MTAGWQRFLMGAALASVLAAIFLAYLRPDFILDLAVRVISCF